MKIIELIECYKKESSKVFNDISNESLEKFVNMIFEAYEKERTIFACGNGGNVASIQNLIVDLNMHPFVSEDKSISKIYRNKFKAVNLCSDTAMITGISNDLGFKFIFSEQLKFQGNEDDILFGMSGSGNSGNIIEAFEVAKQKKMKTILITRNAVTKLDPLSDLVIRLQGVSEFPGQTGSNNNNFHFEDCISKISHMVVGLLKNKVNIESL